MNVQRLQILSEQVITGMAIDIAGAFWGVKDVTFDDHDNIVLGLVDPNSFFETALTLTIPRGIGMEIITEHGVRKYNRPAGILFSGANPDEQTASDRALAELRAKLTGDTSYRWPEDPQEDSQFEDIQLVDEDCPFDDSSEINLNTTDQNPGTHLCYDDWSGRYFRGSVSFLESAEARLNTIIAQEGEASLNDYYDMLGLTPLPMGTEFGWKEPVSLMFGSMLTRGGDPYISASFRTYPKQWSSR